MIEGGLSYFGHQPAFAGFMLLFCAALLVTLRRVPQGPALSAVDAGALAAPPLLTGLGIQLLFIPFLWTHTSDLPQVFGRFSLAYFSVVGLNILLIATIALALCFRHRLGTAIGAGSQGWRAYVYALLLAALVFFALTQARSIHHKAATFLFISSTAMLDMACWQLASLAPGASARRLCWLAAFASLLTLLSYGVLIGLSLYVHGFVEGRIMASSNALHVAAGVPWGVCLGLLLRRSTPIDQDKDKGMIALGAAALLVAATIGCGILVEHRRELPRLARFAREWDERHLEIVRQRDAGNTTIVVPELSYNLGGTLLGFSIFDDSYNGCPKLYYGVESITRSGAG